MSDLSSTKSEDDVNLKDSRRTFKRVIDYWSTPEHIEFGLRKGPNLDTKII